MQVLTFWGFLAIPSHGLKVYYHSSDYESFLYLCQASAMYKTQALHVLTFNPTAKGRPPSTPPSLSASAKTGKEAASSTTSGIFHMEQETLTQEHGRENLPPSARGLAAIHPCSAGDKQRWRQGKHSLPMIPTSLGSGSRGTGRTSPTVPPGMHFSTGSGNGRILTGTPPLLSPPFPGAIFGQLSLPPHKHSLSIRAAPRAPLNPAPPPRSLTGVWGLAAGPAAGTQTALGPAFSRSAPPSS